MKHRLSPPAVKDAAACCLLAGNPTADGHQPIVPTGEHAALRRAAPPRQSLARRPNNTR